MIDIRYPLLCIFLSGLTIGLVLANLAFTLGGI